MKLSADMQRVVREQRLGFVATVTPDGRPNLSPKGTTGLWDDERLFFADIASPGTVAEPAAPDLTNVSLPKAKHGDPEVVTKTVKKAVAAGTALTADRKTERLVGAITFGIFLRARTTQSEILSRGRAAIAAAGTYALGKDRRCAIARRADPAALID